MSNLIDLDELYEDLKNYDDKTGNNKNNQFSSTLKDVLDILDKQHKDVTLNYVRDIVKCCEDVQNSQESRYAKQCAIEVAYEKIRKIVL